MAISSDKLSPKKSVDLEACGCVFALVRLSLRTRLSGLLGEVRFGCVPGVLCFADLSDSLTLGENGVAKGDFWRVVPGNSDPKCLDGEPPGVNGEGDRGERGEAHPSLGDFFKWNLDGERDSERLRVLSADLKAEPASEVVKCVGEGSVKVPPLPE